MGSLFVHWILHLSGHFLPPGVRDFVIHSYRLQFGDDT